MSKNNATIQNGWQKSTIGEISNMNLHSIGLDFVHSEIEYIDISSVGVGNLLGTTNYEIKEAPCRAKRLVSEGDTILSTVRPNRRSFLYIKNPAKNTVVSTGFVVLSPKKETDSKFLYYIISDPRFADYLSANTKGSAYPAVSSEVINNAEILVPEYKIQKLISSILSSFDDKIENNNRIITTLETMAQGIFKEWFVKFRFLGYEKARFVDSEMGKIPEGWEVKKVSDMAILNRGLSYSSPEINDEGKGLPMINLANFQRGGGFNYSGIKHYTGKYKKTNIVKPGDIVIAMTDLTHNREVIGHPARVPTYDNQKNILISLDVCSMTIDDIYTEFLYYMMLNKSFSYLMASSASGTNVSHLSKSSIENYSFTLPSKDVLQKFKQTIQPIFTQSHILESENKGLIKMRDLLLPKLMNGKIKI